MGDKERQSGSVSGTERFCSSFHASTMSNVISLVNKSDHIRRTVCPSLPRLFLSTIAATRHLSSFLSLLLLRSAMKQYRRSLRARKREGWREKERKASFHPHFLAAAVAFLMIGLGHRKSIGFRVQVFGVRCSSFVLVFPRRPQLLLSQARQQTRRSPIS